MAGSIRTRLPHSNGPRRIRFRKPATWWPSLAARQDEAFRTIWQGLRQHQHASTGTRFSEDMIERSDTLVACAINVPTTDEMREAMDPLQQALRSVDFIHVYPFEHLQILIQELGLVVDAPTRPDEISRSRIQEFIRHASVPIGDFPAFDVTIGGFNSFLDAPFLDVHDDGWCHRVHHRLREFILAQPHDDFAFLPHIVLGFYKHASELGSFPATMARWRDRQFGSFVARSVDLIEISTLDPDAQPRLLHRFELGNERSPTDAISASPSDLL